MKPVKRPTPRSGAVVLWVLAALAVGLLLGLGFGKGWGLGGGKNGDSGGAPNNAPKLAADIRVTGTGVEWQGKTIQFADLAASAENIKAAAGDKPVRVVFAKDVNHLDEETVRTALRNTGLQVVESNE